jgi:superfamily II DNA or RNA helicase
MYFHRQVQCQQAADRLRTAGIACDVVTGSSDVDQQIEDFSDGKLSVLINCMKLTEGINLPELKTVFVRPSCKPVTIQMAGRVLRKHPNVPVKQIVQSEKTPYPFTKLAIAELQHVRLNDTWRTLQVNPHIDSITKRTMAAMIKTEIEIPKFITKHTQRAAPIGRRGTRDNFPGGLGPVSQMNDEAHEGEIERDRGTIEMDSTLAFEARIANRVEGHK